MRWCWFFEVEVEDEVKDEVKDEVEVEVEVEVEIEVGDRDDTYDGCRPLRPSGLPGDFVLNSSSFIKIVMDYSLIYVDTS